MKKVEIKGLLSRKADEAKKLIESAASETEATYRYERFIGAAQFALQAELISSAEFEMTTDIVFDVFNNKLAKLVK